MRRLQVALVLVLLCRNAEAQSLNYYFGNIHSHTAFSDGNKDSASTGVGRPDGSYDYAKLSQDFDFLGISEHNHYSSSHNPGFKQPLYQAGMKMADNKNEEGNFLALFGMEYGVSSQYNGHVLVYGYEKLLGWETGVPGVSGNNYDVFNDKTDYAGLFAKVNAHAGAFCYLAHPSFDDFTTDGTWNTSIANAPYNASFDSAIVGMPLRSGLASSSGATYSDYSTGNYFNFYKKMLYTGYHLGIGYDHDNHYTNFGRGNGGRLVILAPALTRSDFYDAMREMRFYGSDDMNAKVTFSCNGALMGRVIKGNDYPTLTVLHADPDGELADTIKIWRGSANSGGLWAEIVYGSLQNNTAAYTDFDVQPGKEYYYFAEIRQKDGQWIVTSPVWYTPVAPLSLREHNKLLSTVYYDEVMKELHISVAQNAACSVTVSDGQGRSVYTDHFSGNSTVCDLSALNAGLYLVLLVDGQKKSVTKLLVR
jgi:hypothetical protein